jgi:gliding motility-associated lipoprotein GldD
MKIFSTLVLIIILASCGNDELLIPKPPTYLRLDFPDHTYINVQSECGFTIDIPSAYSFKNTQKNTVGICNQEIDLGPLNGTLYLFYYPLTAKDTLAKFINFSNDKVDDHKLKATAINDQKILRSKDKVYGTFFELQGDVATNYQFYLTDSTNHFLRAELLLNSRPNYDSLKPHLDYIQVDLLKMANSLKWK